MLHQVQLHLGVHLLKGLIGLHICLFINFNNFGVCRSFQDDSFLDSQLTLNIEDNVEDPSSDSYSLRTVIHIRSVKLGNAVITYSRKWSEAHFIQLKNMSEADELYKIRVWKKGSEEKGYVSTFTKSCLLYESGLKETLSIMLDGTGDSVVGVGLITPVPICKGVLDIPLITTLNTTVLVRSPIMAPIPDTASFIQKMEAMKMEKAEGKDNRSFLAKYWMYIVPVVLILLISGGGQEAQR